MWSKRAQMEENERGILHVETNVRAIKTVGVI